MPNDLIDSIKSFGQGTMNILQAPVKAAQAVGEAVLGTPATTSQQAQDAQAPPSPTVQNTPTGTVQVKNFNE